MVTTKRSVAHNGTRNDSNNESFGVKLLLCFFSGKVGQYALKHPSFSNSYVIFGRISHFAFRA